MRILKRITFLAALCIGAYCFDCTQSHAFSNTSSMSDDEEIIRAAKDEETLKAFDIFINEANQTPDIVQNNQVYCNLPDYIGEFNSLLKKANAGDVDSMYKLGIYYAHACSDERKLAAKWLFKAVVKNYIPAFYESALLIYGGEGFINKEGTNIKLSNALMLKAANNGYSKAQVWLASELLSDISSGSGDIQTYQNWLLKAANQGDVMGAYMLGSNYIDGNAGFKKDLKSGIKLLKSCIALEKDSISTTSFINDYSSKYIQDAVNQAKSKLSDTLNRR